MSETVMPYELDETDRTLIAVLRMTPRASGVELARRAAVSRNTVQLRLERLAKHGIITGYGPDITGRSAGFQVLAFVTLTIAQGAHQETVTELSKVAEILEIHTTTGDGDLLLKVIAKTNDDLHSIIQQIAAIDQVKRTDTQLSLATSLERTVADLIASTTPG